MASAKNLILLVLVLPAVCHGFILGRNQSDWNGLKAKWGDFQSFPRTRKDAEAQGWVNMVPGQSGCGGDNKFLGTRYWKDSDTGVILIYDNSGYIAGIQAGFRKDYSDNQNNFPYPEQQNKSMVQDGDSYYITAYFVDPAIICSGRSKAQFDQQGTGGGLWIQNGSNPIIDSIKAPSTQVEADSSMWTKGYCFVTMGVHYWYNVDLDMSCNDFFPVFLLYNKGVLNAFGWALQINLRNSKHFEHPPQTVYGQFMNPVPKCLSSLGTLTTLHIYLTDSPEDDKC